MSALYVGYNFPASQLFHSQVSSGIKITCRNTTAISSEVTHANAVPKAWSCSRNQHTTFALSVKTMKKKNHTSLNPLRFHRLF